MQEGPVWQAVCQQGRLAQGMCHGSPWSGGSSARPQVAGPKGHHSHRSIGHGNPGDCNVVGPGRTQ
jgi:hypothetical protein